MKKRIKFWIMIKNSFLYERMINSVKVVNNEKENDGVEGVNSFMEIMGNDGKKIIFNTIEKYENVKWDLFPKNLYEISPFIFLYLLRLKDYSLEEYQNIRKSFLSDFPEIVDGYKYAKITLVMEESDLGDGFAAGEFRINYKELQYVNGLITYSNVSELKRIEQPTAAKNMNKAEKERIKYDEDLKAYRCALGAFEMETNYK